MSESSITVIGNVATDPQLVTSTSGIPVLRLRVASSQRRFDRERKEWVDASTNWFGVTAFRALAENVYSSVRKGDRVIVTGRLHLREWTKDERRGISAEVEAEAVGPDLRWGTTTFARTAVAAGASSRDESWAASAEGPRADGDSGRADEHRAGGRAGEAGSTGGSERAPSDESEGLLPEPPF